LKFSLAGLRRHPVLLCVPAQPALHAALAEQLERFFALQFLPPLSAQQRPQLLALLHDKAGLITPAIPGGVDAALLAQAPHLRAICKSVAAYADIDLAACTAAEVMVTNSPSVVSASGPDIGRVNDWVSGRVSDPDAGSSTGAESEAALWHRHRVAGENLLAAFGFGRLISHPRNLLNVELRCTLGCCA
jgi:hypothetical protein